ncbi:THUMP domain-containing protein [Saccharolobus caldissimus]|uniref:RNA methyltransferase n=1 Tax=Saccharolobus caldissimus TaxID=1702097 RepID=A0AAQ4CPH3_9CREN|nr:THUMP domain-containing protein [Saccharolobus caldissimus]BDB97704.1 RNA methyltransferase [Saccharolobus caldissimus]
MESNVKCLITTKPNKGKKCINEILNRLLTKDINAKVIEYINNILLVYSNLDPMIIYGLLISSPPSCAEKIFPFHLILEKDEKKIISETMNFMINKFKNIKTFFVRCYNRGGEINCRTIEMGIGISLRNFLIVDFKNPDIIIYVNILKEFVGISFLKKGQEKFQLTLSHKI